MHHNRGENRKNRIEGRFDEDSLGFSWVVRSYRFAFNFPAQRLRVGATHDMLPALFTPFSYLESGKMPRVAGPILSGNPFAGDYTASPHFLVPESGAKMSKQASSAVSRRLFLTFSACHWPAFANFPI
jgi:hypothetical protein